MVFEESELKRSFVLTTLVLISSILGTTPLVSMNASTGFSSQFLQSDSPVMQFESTSADLFLQNVGQFPDEHVLFYGKIGSDFIGFGSSEVFLWKANTEFPTTLKFNTVQSVAPIGIERADHLTNFILGNRYHYTGVESFGCIHYDDLWPGISLNYRIVSDGAKYEFIVQPGADPDVIKISCEGSDELSVDIDSISIVKGDVVFHDKGLVAFQDCVEVDIEFVQFGATQFGFRTSEYNRSKELIIDPIIYSTYLGGGMNEEAYCIASDTLGNAYVAGDTSGLFPLVEAYDSTYNGGDTDCFLSKFDTFGNLVYSTYIGGSSQENARCIAVDNERNIYLAGSTYSSDFPTQNPYCDVCGGSRDVFLMKLAADGASLIFSTYIGGADYDRPEEIAIDSTGRSYVCGETRSSNFPVNNALYPSFMGDTDCFILRMSSDGQTLEYSTFIGGNELDEAKGLDIDSSGAVYLIGETKSIDFPLVNEFDSEIGILDCFVLKLDSSGESILYSTLVGGSSYEFPFSIAVDDSGNAYVVGITMGDFPIVNAYNSSYGGGDVDGFIFKLNSTGNGLLFSTYLGGRGDFDDIVEVSIAENSHIFVAGYTTSSDFPLVDPIPGAAPESGSDCFLSEFNAEGTSLVLSTRIGGNDNDECYAMCLDSQGAIYLTGETWSEDFPVINAYDSSFNGGQEPSISDCFVFKYADVIPTYPTESTETTNTDGTYGAGTIPDLLSFVTSVDGVFLIGVVVLALVFVKKR
jgi:hypothetical protein